MNIVLLLFFTILSCSAFSESQDVEKWTECSIDQIGFLSDVEQTHEREDPSYRCFSQYEQFWRQMNYTMLPIVKQIAQLDQSDRNLESVLKILYEPTKELYCSEIGRMAIQCRIDYAYSVCPDLKDRLKTIVQNIRMPPAGSIIFEVMANGISSVCLGKVNSQSYSANVRLLLEDLQSQYHSSSTCVTEARLKMDTFSNYTEDMKYAVALINLYSQSCRLTNGNFYEVLNENLRSGQPKPFWKHTENLLNQGIELLGESHFPSLYRGCANKNQFQQGESYRFNQFISTSLEISVAQNFAGQGANSVLFKIKNASGVLIHEYSEFPDEKEVLLKSSSTFKVLSVEMHNGVTVIELQYTKRFRRSDTPISEATLCDSDHTSSGVENQSTSYRVFSVFIVIQIVNNIL